MQELRSEEETREKAKVAIGVASKRILAKPEAHSKDLNAILTLASHSDGMVTPPLLRVPLALRCSYAPSRQQQRSTVLSESC